MSYSSVHETSDLRSYAFKAGAPRAGRRVALLRCLRPQALPDPFSQLPRRTSASQIAENLGCGSQTVRNAIHSFNEKRLAALVAGCSRPKEVHAAFDEGRAESLRQMLHQPPSIFGKQSTFWTLAMAALVSFEEGLTEREVSRQTIRATLARLGVRWKRAKRSIESPDPEYARKRGSRSADPARPEPSGVGFGLRG
jgi:transposase